MLYRRRRASKPLSHSPIPRSDRRLAFVYTEYCRSFYSLRKRGLQPVADSKAPSVSQPLISDDDAACPLSFMTFLSALFPLLPSVLPEFLSPPPALRKLGGRCIRSARFRFSLEALGKQAALSSRYILKTPPRGPLSSLVDTILVQEVPCDVF